MCLTIHAKQYTVLKSKNLGHTLFLYNFTSSIYGFTLFAIHSTNAYFVKKKETRTDILVIVGKSFPSETFWVGINSIKSNP